MFDYDYIIWPEGFELLGLLRRKQARHKAGLYQSGAPKNVRNRERSPALQTAQSKERSKERLLVAAMLFLLMPILGRCVGIEFMFDAPQEEGARGQAQNRGEAAAKQKTA